MATEALDPNQPWPIDLPQEPERDRVLEARDEAGQVFARWEWDDEHQFWHTDSFSIRKWWSWDEIVSHGIVRDRTLVSLPPETGDGA